MASTQFKNLAKAMREFVQNSQKYPNSIDSFWPKLRVAFIEVKNKGLTTDLSPETYDDLQVIKNTKGFSENIGEKLMCSVYPAMKLQNTVIDFDDNMQPLIHIRAPAIPIQKSPRNSTRKSVEIPNLLPSRNIPPLPQTSRVHRPKSIIPSDVPLKPFPPFVPKDIKPAGDFISSLKLPKEIETEITKQEIPWNDNFVLNNETDALTYVGAVDPKNDFLQFHVGQVDKSDPYSFKLYRRLDDNTNEFHSMTKRGVFSAKSTGESDFTPIDQYVTNKSQYNMITTIKFFSQFKMYKYFKYWRNRSIRKTFQRRLDSFIDTCWSAKLSFPPIYFKIRNDLNSLRSISVFPIKDSGEVEFQKEYTLLDTAREDFADKINLISKEIYQLLSKFANDVNSKYNDLVSNANTSYITEKKIPSDIYYMHKMPRKKSLSLVEEKQRKIDHIVRVQRAKSEVEKIRNFFMVCDKTVLQFFLNMFENQFHTFAKTFYDSSHTMLMHLELNYEGNDIAFSPNKTSMIKLVNEHIETLFMYLSNFSRPCLIDPRGYEKELTMSPKTSILKNFIQNHDQFKSDYNNLIKSINDSYSDAEETLKLYQTSARFIYDFKEQWEEMKEKDVDPSIYINNITKLTNTLEEVETFKGTYVHKQLLVDIRALRSFLVEYTRKSIDENNTILFRKFEFICTNFIQDVTDLMNGMKYFGETLEENAKFNVGISKAESEIPNLKSTIELVESIFKRAQTSVPLLVPNLLIHLKNVRNINKKFEETLEYAKLRVKQKREEVINQLKENQKKLENRLEDLDNLNKTKYSKVDVNAQPENAISDLESVIAISDELLNDIEAFKVTAFQLEYSEYNFDLRTKIKADLNKNLENWKTYNNFMNELTSITETPIMDIDILTFMHFINQHSEREMRSVHHPLYDRMANHYALLYQYMPFFNIISKIKLTQEIWEGIFDILEKSKENMKKITTKAFLDQSILAHIDKIKIYIMNLQQQADLSQTFDKYILQMKALVLDVKPSLTIKPPIITFPSIYEALTTCENFQLYLRTLKDSQFYSSIEKQVLYWEAVLFQLGRIFHYLLMFQTKYVILSETTSALFGEIHFPHEEQSKAFIDKWYNDLIKQVKFDPHVMQLIVPVDPNDPQASDPRHKKVVIEAINFADVLHRDFKKESLDTKDPPPVVNKDYDKPIYCGADPYFRGENLVQCLEEGTTRCEYILSNATYLLDQQRQKFPRFFFCTDKNVIDIMLACTNIKFIVNDLIPIFPSLSHFQTTTNKDIETIMGIIATNGEMIQFRADFPYTGLQVVDILQRVEEEMQNSVRASILDAISAREYTPPKQWMIRYPTQSLLIAESTYFSQVINPAITRGKERTDWKALIQKNQDFLKSATEIMSKSSLKCSSIAALASLKIRHRDIIEELMNTDENLNIDSFIWKCHLRHSLTNQTGNEEIMTNIGNLSFKYGYELISHADIGPLTDSEDEAMLSLASCMVNAEFSMCKQMNGVRNIVKSFADFVGLPCFKMSSKIISNVFPGAASCKCVIRLTDVKDLPAAFPNFFGLLESQTKVMKCESHFRKLELNKWQTLIHIDEEKVPTWLMTRLRPIYLQKVNPQDFIKKINQIRPDIPIPSTISTEYLSMAIKQFNARGLINGYHVKEEGLSQHMFYFDVGEYILTNQIVIPKEPISVTIPTFIKAKIDELTVIFDKFDAFAPHSQSPDYPNIPYATTIDILARDHQMSMICIYAALKESIAIAKFQLVSISDDLIKFECVGCRPVALNISSKAEKLGAGAWISPEPSVFDFLQIALQQPEISSVYNQLEPLVRVYVNGILDTDEDIVNSCLSKINLIRRFLKENAAAAAITTIEAVFGNGDRESLGLTKQFELETPFAMNIPIVIQSDLSSGKRKYLKNLILQKTKPEDVVYFSSAFNECVDMSMMNNLEFITRGLYGPNFDGEIYIVVFDVQEAIFEMKKFIKALVMFGSLFFRTFDKYQNVRGIHLICTTTDISLFNDMGVQYYLITEFPKFDINLNETIDTKAVRKESLDKLKEEIAKNNDYHKAIEFSKVVPKIKDESDYFVLTSLYFGLETATKCAECYNFNKNNVKRLLNKNKNDMMYLSDKIFVSQIQECMKLNLSAILVCENSYPVTKLKDCQYFVVNNRFKTQLFSCLVKAGENKQKTAILFDLQALNPYEVYNVLDLFMFNSDSSDYSTYFELADLQIFKYYYDPKSQDLPIIPEILKSISFFVLVNNELYEKIPNLFKKKMITIRYENCDDIMEEEIKHKEITDIFKPFISISPYLFDDILKMRNDFFKQKIVKFEEKVSKLIDHCESFVEMKKMIEDISNGTVISEEQEHKILEQKENLRMKSEDDKNRLSQLQKEVDDKRRKISENKNKLNKNIVEDFESTVNSISSFTSLEQRKMMHAFNKKDEISEFSKLFVDMFSFVGVNNLTECYGEKEDTKLVSAIKKFKLDSPDKFQFTKIESWGLKKSSQPEKLLRKLQSNRETFRSDIPLVNYLIDFIHICVTYVELNDTNMELQNSLEDPLNEIEKVQTKVEKDEKELTNLTNRLETQTKNGKCPKWIMDAFLVNPQNVTKILESVEQFMINLSKMNKQIESCDKALIVWCAIFTAFEFGFGKLNQKERNEIYNKIGIDAAVFSSPFRLLEQFISFDIFAPVTKKLSLFSPLSENELISNSTTIIFSSLLSYDSILGTKLLPGNYSLPGYDLPAPFLVYYDPLDLIVETIIGNYKNCSCCFISSKDSVYSVFIHALSNGYPLIVYIDSLDNLNDFFTFARHTMIQYLSTKVITFDGEDSKINENTKIFFVTEIPDLLQNQRKDFVLVDCSITNVNQTKWFEMATVFTINSQIKDTYIKDINSIDTCSKQVISLLDQFKDLKDWEFLFTNNDYLMSYQKNVDLFNDSYRIIHNSVNNLTQMNALSNEHPNAIFRYKQFTGLCQSLASSHELTKSNDKLSQEKNVSYQLQVISALQEFTKSRDGASMAPMTTLTGFPEMTLYFTNIIYSFERVQFLVDFETKYMKNNVQNQYLLFEQYFPGVGDRPITSNLQRLMNHVASRFMNVPRSFYTFCTPDTLPMPGNRPVLIILDSLIPTDLYSRAMSQFLTTKDMTLLTIGSFSNASLSTPMSVNTIIKGCHEKNAMLLVIFDEMMPNYIIPSLLHFTHINKFSNYYILVSEMLYDKLPHIPNALITRVSRPTSLFGASRFLNITPYFHRMNAKSLKPFLYFNLLLSHRRDYPLRLQHILPMLLYTKEFWETNGMNVSMTRNLWMKIIASLFATLTDRDVVKESYSNLLNKFFKDAIPMMPSQAKIDYYNDSNYSTELPPSPYDVGMLVSFGDEFKIPETPSWTKQIENKFFVIGKVHNAEFVIENAVLHNARFSNEMIGVNGTYMLTLSVLDKEPEHNISPYTVNIDVFDGNEKVGSVTTLFNGNTEILSYGSVFIQLPQNE
ncbi:hypothetical protein TVAG_068390 [Trichomonas vaginalis G3]|uniref:Dynein heavy chain linker domain-containing protein n=1 Tax=Trichomonas vaginalis (strain ATCC PRA-98 / G3) TaxID=412133 RepID=A2FL45_TRIV3|nr:dynein heavy chain family protein family [Trichomonas vaginalis G3]EAX94371.1 hypothetical protein TVAG_068390 [Trichomonas vaginalis G3]KAI5499690.1 dynein heavy chain family protein family [Trichomonas vaginalis G3]|eukprot:XP_001307301.1 hypothetical protein [Trichomonas vaginalis G3]